MVLPYLHSAGVCRSQIPSIPRIFCRHKSLFAAIERGSRGESFPHSASKTPRTHSDRSDQAPRRFNRDEDSPRPARFSNFDADKRGGRSSDRGPSSFQDREKPRGAWKNREEREALPPREQKSEYTRPSGDRKPWTNDRQSDRRVEQNRDSPRGAWKDRGEARQAPDSREQRTDYRRPSGDRQPRQDRSENGYRNRDRDAEQTRPAADKSSPLYGQESLPYTTAASEFLYGHSSVLAALKASRRKLYTLYIHERGQNHEGNHAVVSRARELKVPIVEVGEGQLALMDKASGGRPHNGFILEVSPLPRTPLVKLSSSSMEDGHFNVEQDNMSREDKLVNGTNTRYAYKSAGWRHPLVLYVDGVLDEGNLGAIARSAYFLGVDAVATPTRQSAPWSHIALKASAGAAEAIPIFTVGKPAEFLTQSAREGWRVYASDAIPADPQSTDLSTSATVAEEPSEDASSIVFTHARNPKRLPADHNPVASHPTILMMGAEGSGLRSSLLNQAHYKVGIQAGREDEVGVDSLNVSVAASLLCFEFLKKSPKPQVKTGELLF